MVLEAIATINQAVNNFVWGIPAMVCIIGVGLLLSVRTGFLQIRKFPYAIKTTIGRMFRKKDASDGAMTPFQAVCTALAGTVGTGNIAGVAGAIAIGGPGAVFWMWCSALLGMCTKFAEVTLAVHFRERSAAGEWVGGPMYYIKNGLGRHWQFLAVLYSLFGVLTVFGTGNATQVNTIVAAIDTALTEFNVVGQNALSTLNLVVGIVVAMLVAMVLLGGIKRIGSVSERLVPFMALFYIVLAVGVVILNIQRFPAVIEAIFAGAFNPAAFTGGTIGSVEDFGITDANNMGAAMAPAAFKTIKTHLSDYSRRVEDYDRIITGDLGIFGSDMLYELLRGEGIEIADRHEDCGKLMFSPEQNVNCGASGCGCAATVMSSWFLPKIESGEIRRVLFLATGALMSPVSSLQGESIPSIAHAVVIEHID